MIRDTSVCKWLSLRNRFGLIKLNGLEFWVFNFLHLKKNEIHWVLGVGAQANTCVFHVFTFSRKFKFPILC